jgi:hypothetical protein
MDGKRLRLCRHTTFVFEWIIHIGTQMPEPVDWKPSFADITQAQQSASELKPVATAEKRRAPEARTESLSSYFLLFLSLLCLLLPCLLLLTSRAQECGEVLPAPGEATGGHGLPGVALMPGLPVEVPAS